MTIKLGFSIKRQTIKGNLLSTVSAVYISCDVTGVDFRHHFTQSSLKFSLLQEAGRGVRVWEGEGEG